MDNLITEVDICEEAKDCFLTYSEEVLTDRAIPACEDGLLSAQRKILWTMEEYLKMNNKSKTKKCNALVGSTLATSYYHGDAACYGVLCKMSQKFLMRYPLIQGQGALGTQEDNDMVSQSRYTEAKPSVFADLMMNDFKKDAVPLKETYNGEYMEPVVLPSLFPNSICNGRQAIAIGLAHGSLPHNLTEVCNAIIAFINEGSLTIDEILEHIPGPDFPLPNTILNSQDVREAFKTGKSRVSLKVQGNYEIKDNKIIFTTIPYRTYRNKIKEQITKNIDILDEVIEDFDDESSVGQNRLIFYIKKGVCPEKALDLLFSLTDLQTTVSYNMNFIVNGTPKLCSMYDLLKSYVDHQESVLIKATQFDKAKAEARAHILEGLIAAVDKINEVIKVIKASEDKDSAKKNLITLLSIDDVQASAILDMKLGKLTRIDKNELVKELEEKKTFITYCNILLNNKEKRNEVLIDKVKWLRDKYGDERRTRLLQLDLEKKDKKKSVIEPKDCVVIITKKNTVKRIDAKSFKTQRRNTVGIKTNGDIVSFSQKTNTQDYLMVFTTKGKVYRLLVDTIPEGTNTSAGSYLNSLIDFEDNEYPIAFTTMNQDTTNKYIFFATKKGIVKKVPVEEYTKLKRTGVIAIKIKEGDELAVATFINQEQIIVLTKKGFAIRFDTAEIAQSSRIAQGIKGMKVEEGDYVVAALPIHNPESDYLAIVSKIGLGKKTSIKEFPLQARGGKGVICSKEEIGGSLIIKDEDNILINGDTSSIVVSGKDFPELARTSAGNIMIKNNNNISYIAEV